jgi:hypothetical protein
VTSYSTFVFVLIAAIFAPAITALDGSVTRPVREALVDWPCTTGQTERKSRNEAIEGRRTGRPPGVRGAMLQFVEFWLTPLGEEVHSLSAATATVVTLNSTGWRTENVGTAVELGSSNGQPARTSNLAWFESLRWMLALFSAVTSCRRDHNLTRFHSSRP